MRTIFLAECSVREAMVARGEVKQILEKRQFLGTRWERENRASSHPDANERGENKGGEDREVV